MCLITAEDRLYTSAELLHIKRLYNEIVSTQLKTEDLVKYLALSGDHYDRLTRHLTDLAADLPTVLFRKHYIKQNKIGLIYLEIIQTLYAIVSYLNTVSLIFKIELKQFTYIGRGI